MRPKSKTALVLAGGGIPGAVYEIGALRAINDLLIDMDVNHFDIYVGTSAGAFVSTFLANGVCPEEMLAVMDGSNPNVEAIERQHIFRFNREDYLNWGVRMPKKLIRTWGNYLRHITDMSLFDLVWSMSEALPAGLYDGMGLEHYIRQTLADLGCSNSFADLDRELHIITTDLDTGERTVFGPGHLDAPISLAAAASGALPLVYKPVNIHGKDYIDGGLRGAASIDLAIEHGARLIVCINPLVPLDYSSPSAGTGENDSSEHLSRRGVQSIAGQAIRIFSHAGLHYHVKQLRRAHPQVDIILIEPKADDRRMFFSNIMHYSDRLIVAEHGFESVTLDLAADYQQYKDVLSRHGIRITRQLVIEELAEIEQSNRDPEVIRRVMEANRLGDWRKDRVDPTYQLAKILTDLDSLLDENITA